MIGVLSRAHRLGHVLSCLGVNYFSTFTISQLNINIMITKRLQCLGAEVLGEICMKLGHLLVPHVSLSEHIALGVRSPLPPNSARQRRTAQDRIGVLVCRSSLATSVLLIVDSRHSPVPPITLSFSRFIAFFSSLLGFSVV